jgi:serine/threonine-protein kinase
VADPLLGRVIAERYRIVELIGRGGMGVVYKAEHVHIGKVVALKLLHGELVRDREVIKRFRREAEAASKLSHPNTVQIFDFGESQGLMYLVMEFVEGRDLGQIVQAQGALPFARAARICAQVCASVQQAHRLGIVHRDIKPENVMVSETPGHADFVKVLDFGLAKLRQEGSRQPTVTRAGHIVGTPYYMSPEQIRGEEVDARGDVYAIGAVLYKTCTAHPPFSAPSPMAVLTKHLTEELLPPSARLEGLPADADRIAGRAMAKDPRKRYEQAEDLRRELLEYLASVGEELGPDTLSGSGKVALDRPQRPAERDAATRRELNAYERRLARRGRVSSVLITLVLVGAAATGWGLWPGRIRWGSTTTEQEPNDAVQQANPLPPDTRVEGYLGKRIAPDKSDADVYRLKRPDSRRGAVSFEVTGIPNMDIVVDLLRKGRSTPVFRANGGGIGEPERAPNLPLGSAPHYLRVHEVWRSGRRATENVSDSYTIQWNPVERQSGDEREPNDALELATPIAPGDARRGYIGWPGDLDYYCLDADAPRVVAKLAPVPELDLVLRKIDRVRASSHKTDEQGVGEGETAPAVRDAREGSTCFEVSVAPGNGERAAPEQRYVLRIRDGASLQ